MFSPKISGLIKMVIPLDVRSVIQSTSLSDIIDCTKKTNNTLNGREMNKITLDIWQVSRGTFIVISVERKSRSCLVKTRTHLLFTALMGTMIIGPQKTKSLLI